VGLEDGWSIAPSDSTEKVVLDTFDRFCGENNIVEVDFLKIDTEGHEVAVFQGARESLRRNAIRMIQFEYGGTYIDSRRLLKDVFDLVAPFDYKIFLIAPEGLTAVPRYDQRLENFQYKNFAMFRSDAVKLSEAAQQALHRLP
jgi:hypothetical protein